MVPPLVDQPAGGEELSSALILSGSVSDFVVSVGPSIRSVGDEFLQEDVESPACWSGRQYQVNQVHQLLDVCEKWVTASSLRHDCCRSFSRLSGDREGKLELVLRYITHSWPEWTLRTPSRQKHDPDLRKQVPSQRLTTSAISNGPSPRPGGTPVKRKHHCQMPQAASVKETYLCSALDDNTGSRPLGPV